MSLVTTCLTVWVASALLVNALKGSDSVPTSLSLCLLTTLAMLLYLRWPLERRPRNKVRPHDQGTGDTGACSTALCLRGFTYGLSRETCERSYQEVVAYLDAHPAIRTAVWDGDLNGEGCFAAVIQRLMLDRPELQFVAFKKKKSMHKLGGSYKETNNYGVVMTGFTTIADAEPECYAYDALAFPWAPTARFTVIGFPTERLESTENPSYVELTYAGLSFLRHAMGHTHVTILTMGEGPVVQAEKARIGNGEMELDERGDPLFPRVERWVSLEVQRE